MTKTEIDRVVAAHDADACMRILQIAGTYLDGKEQEDVGKIIRKIVELKQSLAKDGCNPILLSQWSFLTGYLAGALKAFRTRHEREQDLDKYLIYGCIVAAIEDCLSCVQKTICRAEYPAGLERPPVGSCLTQAR